MKQSTVQDSLKTSIRLTVVFLAFATLALEAEAGPRIMKADQNGSTGRCTGPLSGSADDVLARNGVRTKGATTSQKFALAKGIQQIERLTGGTFSPARGANFVFLNNTSRGISNQTGGAINMRGGPGRTANTAYLMHELGHKVGNSGYYGKYKSAVRRPCLVTHYCSTHYSKSRYRNEEFGEVFAAFVTHPELLQKSGPACQAAYNFFANNVFKNGKQLASCGAASSLVAQGKDPLGVVRQAASERPQSIAAGEMRASSCPATAKAPAQKLSQLAEFIDDDSHAAAH